MLELLGWFRNKSPPPLLSTISVKGPRERATTGHALSKGLEQDDAEGLEADGRNHDSECIAVELTQLLGRPKSQETNVWNGRRRAPAESPHTRPLPTTHRSAGAPTTEMFEHVLQALDLLEPTHEQEVGPRLFVPRTRDLGLSSLNRDRAGSRGSPRSLRWKPNSRCFAALKALGEMKASMCWI